MSIPNSQSIIVVILSYALIRSRKSSPSLIFYRKKSEVFAQLFFKMMNSGKLKRLIFHANQIKPVRILIGITLDIKINLERTGIFIIIIFPFQEYIFLFIQLFFSIAQ